MSFFDFLKPKKNDLRNQVTQMITKIFPKGEKDKNVITDELLYILNYKIEREEAQKIAIRSVIRSRISGDFNKEVLKQHLAGYCLHHFNDQQFETYYNYVAFLKFADMMFRKSACDVVRRDNGWSA